MAWSAPAHQPIGVVRSTRRNHAVSPSRTYGRRWQKLRAAYLAQFPLCQETGCDQLATVVDHAKPHHGDHDLLYDWSNLRSMCKPHHDAKTARVDGGFGNRIRSR